MSAPRLPRSTVLVGVMMVLASAALVSSQNFSRYFNHDSFFYISHAISSWSQFVDVLTGPDSAQQYRPLALIMASVLRPWLGTDPYGYHFVPVIFHLANVCLVYLAIARLSGKSWTGLLAAFFFGCQGVAFYATYDMGYVSDFLSAFFCLGSLFVFIRFLESLRHSLGVLSLVLFALALGTKEVTLAFPLALLLVSWWWHHRNSRLAEAPAVVALSSGRSAFGAALVSVVPHLALAALFGAFMLAMIWTGVIYPQSEYELGVTRASILQKAFYLKWALNFPPVAWRGKTAMAHWLGTLVWSGILFVWIVVGWPDRRARRQALAGMAVALALLAPALVLQFRVEPWYWYLPSVGSCWALAVLAVTSAEKLWKYSHLRWLLVLPPVLVYLSLSLLIVRHERRTSNAVYMSHVMKAVLEDFRRQFPILPTPPHFYVLPTAEKRVSDYFDSGGLFRLAYGRADLKMEFADYGAPAPTDSRVRVLHFFNGHLDDFSDSYWRMRRGDWQLLWLELFPRAEVTLDPDEFYADRASLSTPDNQPAFLARSRQLLVTIGGTSVRFPEVELPALAQVEVAAKLYGQGSDGVIGELAWESGARAISLWKLEFFVGRERRYASIPTSELSRTGRLVLRCYNSPGKATVADWLGWSVLGVAVRR